MEEPSNVDRAEWARNALMSFAEETGLVRSGDAKDLSLVLGDFLADLMHLCNQENIDLEQAVIDAEFTYREELELEEYDDSEDQDNESEDPDG